MTVQYLRAGGFRFARDGVEILTAPFYSNPGVARLALLPIWPNQSRIDPERRRRSWGDPEAILVGHAHYDHLMDLPTIVKTLEQGRDPNDRIPVLASQTAANLIHEERLAVRPLDADAGNWRREGQWHRYAGGKVRVMALHSEHGNHVGPIKLYGGHQPRPLDHLPHFAYGWVEGQTFAFLIDFMEGDRPVFRIHVQDAASQPPLGFVPRSLLAERRVDLAILTAGGFSQARDYPEGLLRDLEPRHVMIGHWEDFFRGPDEEPLVVRLTDMDELLTRILPVLGECAGRPGPPWEPAGKCWTLPEPELVTTFVPCP